MPTSDVIVTRSSLSTFHKNDSLQILGIKVSENEIYKVIQLLTEDLQHSKNHRISIIIQNYQIIILISTMINKTTYNTTVARSYDMNQSIVKLSGIEPFSGYGIYSLLHEDFVKIGKNSSLIFNKSLQKSVWKPYKILNLQLDLPTFSKMIDLLSKHRLIFSFNPGMTKSELLISLIFVSSSQENLRILIQEVRTRLSKLETLRGELETYQKKDLKRSLLQILLGLNSCSNKSSSIIEYFRSIPAPQYSHSPLYKSSGPLQYLNANKQLQQEVFSINTNHSQITSSPHESPISFIRSINKMTLLENFDWVIEEKKLQKIFQATIFSNYKVHVLIFENTVFLADFEHNHKSGLYIIYRLTGKKMKYVRSILII